MPDKAPTYQGFRIYPRGFLGASLGTTAQQILRPYQEKVLTHQFHPEMFKAPKSAVEVNHNIEQIWSHLLRYNHAILDFDYRQKVLLVALNAFGTDDFMKWTMAQFAGPSTGELHAEFIEDTLDFIMTGKRKLHLTSWLPLLTLSDLNTNVTVPSEKIKTFFVEPETKVARNVKLIDVLQRWCSHEGGFEDMIQTLHILFGDIIA
jgi:hypothetical protein